MKILLAAPQDKEVLGIIGGYCKKALERLGNEVLVFDFRQHPYPKGKFTSCLKSRIRTLFPSMPSPYDVSIIKSLTEQKINRMLFDCVYKFRPDILLVLLGENILPQTITKVSQDLGAITLNWFHDSLLLSYRRSFLENISGFYDYIFIVDSLEVLRNRDIQAKRIETLALGCDPEVHRRTALSPEEIKKYGSDVAFVGTVTPEREKILEALADFNLKIWGRWPTESLRLKGCYQKQDIYKEEAVKVYNASKVIIDIHGLYGIEKEIFNVTPRVFEVPASGGFLLTNHIPQVCEFYKVKEEIITYKDINELKYLISYYLEHPQERQAISERAYQRAHREHTYLERLRMLLKTIKKI